MLEACPRAVVTVNPCQASSSDARLRLGGEHAKRHVMTKPVSATQKAHRTTDAYIPTPWARTTCDVAQPYAKDGVRCPPLRTLISAERRDEPLVVRLGSWRLPPVSVLHVDACMSGESRPQSTMRRRVQEARGSGPCCSRPRDREADVGEFCADCRRRNNV